MVQQAARGSIYDAVPYPSGAFPQTHPDRLATLAALFGLDAAPPDGCRLLEVGCSDGGNLLPMALTLPGARFVGIDLNGRAIARATELALELGLENVRFEEISIVDYEPGAGSFDYVVAHGLYSWVSAPVRERLLALCAHALADNGVAYVSYNLLPGARVPQTLRELLALELEGIDDPLARIAGARRLLALLSGANEQATMLGAEAGSLLDKPDWLLFHDALSPINEPVFFHEFAARAAAHDLQYLAESEFLEMQTGMLPQDIQRELLADDDVLRREQVLDYLRVRRFRRTLLCHAAIEVDRTVRVQRLAGLAVSSPAQTTVEDPLEPARVTFEAPGGSRLRTDHELVVAALTRVCESWPGAVSVVDLLGDDPSAQARDTLFEALLRCFAANVVKLHAAPLALSSRASERPQASPLARLQALEQHERVTNLRHASIKLEDGFDRRVLALLDGTRDREALRAELADVEEVGGDELATMLETSLARLARSALLAA